jgi:predicted acyltransferase
MMTRDPEFASTVDGDIVRSAATSKPERLLSIDVLRGLTIAFMILVNDQLGPAPFHQLSHAVWNGFTATDLVFPTFLFLVGLTTVLSTSARLARGASRKEIFLHTLRRALLLIVFGFVVNNFPLFHMATARYYGVLPRIAICYFVVATLYLMSPKWQSKAVIAVACLLIYWVLMRFVSIPGIGIPTHDVAMNAKDANLAAWLDRQIFRAPHLYEHTRDPEGLLSTLPAISTALFGLLTGIWLRTNRTTGRKASMLAVAGVVLVCLGLAWNPFFPIAKKLWTSSFTLLAGGLSMLLLAASIYVVDTARVGRRKAETNSPESLDHPLIYKPFLVFGTNAILAYLISELGDGVVRSIHFATGNGKVAAFHAISNVIPQPWWASLMYSVIYTALCWLLVVPFYRKKIFLRI